MNSDQWQALSVWFNARTARERLVIVIALAVVMGYATLLANEALDRSIALKSQQLQNLERENRVLSQEHALLRRDAEEEPNIALERQIERLKAQNDRLDIEVGAMSVTLVEPERMAMVLSRVMAKQSSIELLSVENRPAEQLFFRAVESGDPLIVFKHGLKLSLKGSYLDSLRYLADIESLGVRFFWEAAEFEVEDYPTGQLTIEVFTLSTKEQLINV